MDNVSGNIQ